MWSPYYILPVWIFSALFYLQEMNLGKRIVVFIAIALFSLIASASSPEKVVINEVLYDPHGMYIGCFVELLGKPGLNLDGYFLVGVNGNDGRQYNRIDLSGHKIPLDGFFVIAQIKDIPNADMVDTRVDYQNGPDNIELWYKDKKIDAVGYGNFSNAVFTGEGAPALDLSGYSIGRRPDGLDTDNNSVDFVGLTIPSPGATNGGQGIAIVQIGKSFTRWGFIKGLER